ncbi:MAG TPA: glutathione S-transferase N-terminal domain-containing protein [Burkholderiales bacterium]|nr:glutathione S-transferase N-terminal domain-containing protein [Burkholderiales bacterium]
MNVYGSILSPYVRKVRIMLLEKKLAFEFKVHDAWAPDSEIPKLNPLGKVPVLEIAPGQFLFESPLIFRYLQEQGESTLLPPATGEQRWRAEWWQALGNGIIDATVARVLETRRPPDKQMPEKMQREEARIARALAAAQQAATADEFLAGPAFGVADLVFGVALQYLDIRYPHDWRSQVPALQAWFDSTVARPSFEQTLPPGFVKPR